MGNILEEKNNNSSESQVRHYITSSVPPTVYAWEWVFYILIDYTWTKAKNETEFIL